MIGIEKIRRAREVLEGTAIRTPLVRLDADSDMIGALAARLPSVARRRPIPNIDGPTVALFPQESWRDPDSAYLRSAFHDVPWQVPEFIAAYCSPVAPEPPDWVQIMRRYAREPRRILRARLCLRDLSLT